MLSPGERTGKISELERKSFRDKGNDLGFGHMSTGKAMGGVSDGMSV